MSVILADLGWCMARAKFGKYDTPSVQILSPGGAGDPTVDVCINGIAYIRALKDICEKVLAEVVVDTLQKEG